MSRRVAFPPHYKLRWVSVEVIRL